MIKVKKYKKTKNFNLNYKNLKTICNIKFKFFVIMQAFNKNYSMIFVKLNNKLKNNPNKDINQQKRTMIKYL